MNNFTNYLILYFLEMNQKDKIKLKSIHLKGFKSFDSAGETVPIGDLTVLLGANGAGKSNLVAFFSMINYMMTGALQTFIGENGSAESLLHFGLKKTTRISASLEFCSMKAKDTYNFTLSHASGDTLIFTEETITWVQEGKIRPLKITLDPGLKESGLYKDTKDPKSKTSRIIYRLLRNCQVFQFHDTSKTSRIRNKGYVNDNEFLRADGGNLAAFLYAMRKKEDGEKYYERIIRYIRKTIPQFGDFVIKPSALNENYLMLNWKENGSDYLFGPHQLSDGSLRFMAIATLFLQPPATLPSVIILDEPELGLHPAAISTLAGIAKAASKNSQVIMATQSQRLVDEFEPENIVVVERDPERYCSIFKKLDEDKLSEWLEQYSMSELWEKNVIGGQP